MYLVLLGLVYGVYLHHLDVGSTTTRLTKINNFDTSDLSSVAGVNTV
jgi:hypothetical protein